MKNPNIDAMCKLKRDKPMRKVFSTKNIVGKCIPKLNQSPLCLKYHCLSKCNSLCKNKATHVKLPNKTLVELREFVNNAKNNYLANLNPPNKDKVDQREEGEDKE